MKVSHPANVLKAKVPDLSAPPAKEEKRPLEKWGLFVIWSNNQFVIKLSPQEEGGESQHGGNVPHPDVTYVHTPRLRKCESCPVWFLQWFYDDDTDDKNNQPIQGELLQVCEVTSDVLKSSVGDSWTPRYVEAHLRLYLISQHSMFKPKQYFWVCLLHFHSTYEPAFWGSLRSTRCRRRWSSNSRTGRGWSGSGESVLRDLLVRIKQGEKVYWAMRGWLLVGEGV